MLFPQIISAVILVSKPVRNFSVSQTYIAPTKEFKNRSYFAPKLWLSHHCKNQNVDWNTDRLSRSKRLRSHDMLNIYICQYKSLPAGKKTSGKLVQGSERRLSQVLR